MKDVAAIVPYRADTEGVRRRNAEIVLHWLDAAGIRTVLAEHSDAPDDALALPDRAAREHTASNSAPFTKAAACNSGYRRSVADGATIIALVDADTLMHTEPFLQCIDAVRQGLDAVRPFGSLTELSESETAAIAAGGALPSHELAPRDDRRAGERIPLCGGLVIMRTSAYETAGGMDESFIGWGGEDDALSIALTRSGLQCGILEQEIAFHLDHPRSVESRYAHADYANNLARAQWWHTSDDATLAEAISAGRTRLRGELS